MPRRPTKREPRDKVPKRAAAIAEHFSRRRDDLGETQMQFARRMGISQNQISEIEQGYCNPKLLTLEAWAEKLCMDVADLLRFPAKS